MQRAAIRLKEYQKTKNLVRMVVEASRMLNGSAFQTRHSFMANFDKEAAQYYTVPRPYLASINSMR